MDRTFRIIEDLPKEEQQPFREWLAYQTRPVNKDGTCGFYEYDYERWKEGVNV